MKQRILIVDDKPANLLALRHTLAPLDVGVISATDGNSALVQTLNHEFAVAIIDVQMPGMNGYELAEILRSEPKTAHLPILFMSAIYHDEHHIFRGYEAGAVDFLVKPYAPEVLRNKIAFFLELDRQSQALRDKLALEQSRGFLQSIVTSVADAVLVEVNGEITLVNPVAESLLGPATSLLGRSIKSVFCEPAVVDTLTPGERHATYLRSISGADIPVDVVLSSLSDRPGRVLLATDQTAAIEAARAKEELQEQLYHAQRMESVGRMAGGVAHDLNNVFTIIQSCCGLLLESADLEDPGRTDLDHAMNAAKQGEALVRQLLAFGRKQHMQPRPTDLRDAVANAFEMIERLMTTRVSISITRHEHPLIVEVDPDQLMQVLVNLAVNARDAMAEDGGVLEVITGHMKRDGASWAYIEVKDDGKGIEPHILEHIFEPFFTTKDANSGTGLGLSVVHGIVNQSGGTVDVRSIPGEGTTFRVCFEVTTLQVEAEDGAPAPTVTTASDTILVVEDNPSVLRMVVKVLERKGFEVLSAPGLGQAIDAARTSGDLDLLFTDVNLADTTGIEVARAVRQIHPNLPVLLMSGSAQHTLADQGMPDAPVGFLQKPFIPSQLIDKVQQTLEE